MTAQTIARLLLAPALIGVNAFFVAAEFALTRLPSLDLTEEDLQASPGLRRAHSMLDRLEIHLTGCQLGISTSSVLLGVLAEPAVTAMIEPGLEMVGVTGASVHGISVAVAVVALNLAHKIWGEQAPTYLGVERPRQVAERLAPALYWWSKIAGPVIRLGDGAAKWTLRLFGVEITRSWASEEVQERDPQEAERHPTGDRAALKRQIAKVLEGGRISEDRREEILATLDIGTLPSRAVMIPARDLVALAVDAPADENRRRIGLAGHTRYPVLKVDRDDLDGIVADDLAGILYVAGLFDPLDRLQSDPIDLTDLLHPPVVLDVDLPVAELIDELQSAGQELALLKENGSIVGAVTVTDALEAIAGDLRDPFDRT